MSFIELFFVSVSLAMDAFAVSVSNGLMLPKIKIRHAIIFGSFFGGFQFIMPLIGYALASRFAQYIVSFDHWIAFILLAIIGGGMIKDSFSEEEASAAQTESKIMSASNLTALAIATSIDALAVGVTLALMPGTNIWFSCLVIGIVAFVISYIGVMLGKKISGVFQSYAARVGGCVLIIIGLKILIEHLFFGG